MTATHVTTDGEIVRDTILHERTATAGTVFVTAQTMLAPPEPSAFVGEDGETCDFLPAPQLESLALDLANRYSELAHIANINLRVLWRAAGGKSGGKPVLGKCQRPSGLLRFFSDADFCVWLAADHLSNIGDARTIEAALYAELCRIGIDDDGKACVLAPDFQGFASEVRRYGLWRLDLHHAETVFKQLRLGEAA